MDTLQESHINHTSGDQQSDERHRAKDAFPSRDRQQRPHRPEARVYRIAENALPTSKAA